MSIAASNYLLELGGEARDDASQSLIEAAPTALTFATYNIRYAVGSLLISGSYMRRLGLTMPSRRRSRITRHLKRAARAFTNSHLMPAPDIIALQEADKETRRAADLHIARELAAQLKMNYAHAASDLPRATPKQPTRWYLDFEEHILADDAGDTGVAILSRYKFDSIERLALPFTICAWRPRTAICATLNAAHRRLHIYNAHIDTHASIEAQLDQHRFLLAHIDEATNNTNDAIIFAGDFNTLSRAACHATRNLLEQHGFTTPFATGTTTWKAGFIRLHTDWIFTRNVRIKNFGVRRWLGVSDHYPVWVTIDASDL